MQAKKIILTLTLCLSGAWASAAVEVRFIDPAQFVDIKDANFRRQDDALEGIQAHFKQLGEKQFPGKQVTFEITDVDLAGRIEPRRHNMDMIRILKDAGDGPMISLRYVVSDGAAEIRRGEARLRDISYMSGFNRYPEGDPLRYEKRMIDAWFKDEFGAGKKSAR